MKYLVGCCWQEDELSHSITSSKIEADVIKTWINFLEDTWVLQQSHAEIKEKQAKYVIKLLNLSDDKF